MFHSSIIHYRNTSPCITKGDIVRVYRNLRDKCYSVQKRQIGGGWKVVAHASVVILKDASFNVSEKGNERVRKEGKKNVHAYVEGVWLSSGFGRSFPQVEIVYNPYQHTAFVRKDTGASQWSAELVCLNERGAYMTPTSGDVCQCDKCGKFDHLGTIWFKDNEFAWAKLCPACIIKMRDDGTEFEID